MNSRAILGISIAAIFAVSAFSIVSAHDSGDPIPGYLTITSTSDFKINTAEKIPHITSVTQEHPITFWAWVLEDNGMEVKVAAVAIHHKNNDHQVFDDDEDKNPTNKDIKSTPVQGFHPHEVTVDLMSFCVVDLASPTWDFRVKDNMVTLVPDAASSVVSPSLSAATGVPGVTAASGWLDVETDEDGNITCVRLHPASVAAKP